MWKEVKRSEGFELELFMLGLFIDLAQFTKKNTYKMLNHELEYILPSRMYLITKLIVLIPHKTEKIVRRDPHSKLHDLDPRINVVSNKTKRLRSPLSSTGNSQKWAFL